MMLHIGENRVIAQRDIVAILPAEKDAGYKSRILLADGSVIRSSIASVTLKHRLSSGALARPSKS